jgi:hypothetical protein
VSPALPPPRSPAKPEVTYQQTYQHEPRGASHSQTLPVGTQPPAAADKSGTLDKEEKDKKKKHGVLSSIFKRKDKESK